MDESGMDDHEMRDRGYAPIGKRCYDDKPSRRTKRTTFIAGYSSDTKSLSATLCFEGYTNKETFLSWVKYCLIPDLPKGKTIIMDNASFHHSKEVKEEIELAGHKILFLPPYSPDLNPIEKQWANLKREVRKLRETMEFDEAVEISFKKRRQHKPI